jgi:biopolymer transport protein ExbD
MKFRKKHKGEGSEVFTDSLNDILFILLMFFLIVATLANLNAKKVDVPRGSKDTKVKKNIIVSIDKDQHMFIGNVPIDISKLDTLLKYEIQKARTAIDTPIVVINADTSASYGNVFRVINAAGRNRVKVVTNVQ